MNTHLGAKRILIYGDSLTFCRAPGKFVRLNEHTRWPGVLQRELGEGFEVIEEGLRARMLKGENPFIGERDGYAQFGPILASHLPLDLVVIMLGTNDASSRTGKVPTDIAADLRMYFPLLRSWCAQQQMPVPRVLVMSPPVVSEEHLDDEFYLGAEAVTRQLPSLYEKVAKSTGSWFFDAGSVALPSRVDGVHLDAKANRDMGTALAAYIVAQMNRKDVVWRKN